MPNTSATGGLLTPNASPAPLQDDALDDFMQAWIVGITGLAGNLVRPRWQPEPPNIPSTGTNWAAFGVQRTESDTFVAELHLGSGDGYNEIRRHEILHFLVSFYGPNAHNYASLLREGMQLSQNHDTLSANSMGLVESGDTTTVPELIKQKWTKRVDLPFSVRRQIVRDYQVLTITSANGTLNNEHYTENISA